MKVVAPEGYEIDRENSTLECIKFKPIDKKLTYEDVAKTLFCDDECWYIDEYAHINRCCDGVTEYVSKNPINCTSKKQAEKLFAINKLMNVAKYLNGDFELDWENPSQNKYYLRICDGEIEVGVCRSFCSDVAFFKNPCYAKKAIEILGKDTIRTALSTEW